MNENVKDLPKCDIVTVYESMHESMPTDQNGESKQEQEFQQINAEYDTSGAELAATKDLNENAKKDGSKQITHLPNGTASCTSENVKASKAYIKLDALRATESSQSRSTTTASNDQDRNAVRNKTKDKLQSHPENTLNLESLNQSENDAELDAKPMTPYPTDKNKKPFDYFAGNNGHSLDDKRSDRGNFQCQFENEVLRPKNQFDQPMEWDQLVDIVIVYAKSDYDTALRFQEWLQRVARENNLNDIEIFLYTSEEFPSNDVKVVEEVVNRSMRVLMLLSENFLDEVSLNFIKEEAIGMTRLQELPEQEQMSLFATTIINRKKNCVRPVHTAAKKSRYYRTPAGLAALRAFEFFEGNKNQKHEDDIAAAFLKKAREDREFHIKEIRGHQSRNNPGVQQVTENRKNTRYSFDDEAYGGSTNGNNYPNSFLSKQADYVSERKVQRGSFEQATLKGSTSVDVSKTSQIKESKHSSEMKRLEFVDQRRPSNIEQQSEVVGPSMQTLHQQQSTNKIKSSALQQTSLHSSDYASNKPFEHVFIGKLDSLPRQEFQKISKPDKHGTSLRPNPNYTSQPDEFRTPDTSDIHHDGICSLERSDVEQDSSKSIIIAKEKPKKAAIENSMSLQPDLHSMLEEKQYKQNGSPQKTSVDPQAKFVSKHKNIDDSDEVRENIISYSGPSGRSGIRTRANPEYNEYLVGVPNTNRQGTRHANDDNEGLDIWSQPTRFNQRSTYALRPPPPPPLPPVVTTASSIHYHYHYPDSSLVGDVEMDAASMVASHQPSRRRGPPSPDRHQPATAISGPIFNIQGCGSVQIGDGNRVVGDQNVQGTNNLSTDRSNDNYEIMDHQQTVTLPEHQDSIEEPLQTYGSQHRESLNILSPNECSEKEKVFDSDSSDNNSDEENSTVEITNKNLESGDLFGSGNEDMSSNLSSSLQDKKTREKAVNVFEKKIVDKENGTSIPTNDNDQLPKHEAKTLESPSSILSEESSKSFVSTMELTVLTSCVQRQKKTRYYCLQHYSQHFRCQIPCPGDVDYDDDID